MLRRFYLRFSLRTQLIAVILLTCTLAMLVAGVTLFFAEIARARAALSEELTSQAQLIGDRSSAALVFLDNKTAKENLAAFSGLEQIDSACLFNDQGVVFAHYERQGTPFACGAMLPIRQRYAHFDSGAVHVQVPVLSSDELIGAIQINSTSAPLIREITSQALSLFLSLGGALVVAALLTLRLQRMISSPLAQVREVANAVVDSGDYTLRAPDLGKHELGQLASAFNRMLTTIGTQNKALAESEEYARRLFYDSPIPQIVADPHNLVYYDCNQAAAAIHGYKMRQELVGKTTLDLSAPVQRDGSPSAELMAARTIAAKQRGSNVGEWCYQRADGTLWDGIATVMRFTLKGRELLHISLEDITHRKLAEERLQQLNQELEERVESRTAQLASANTELQKTLDELRHAQEELVQREKMASLGVLIAGVAHEMNTPLGNSLTVSSAIEEELNIFDASMAAGTLTRTRLQGFVEQMRTGVKLLLRNLERAVDQVTHFKQVAVDQTSDQRRSFELDKIVADIVEIVQPQFKRTPHRIVVDIPPNCVMDSYPGAIGQVLTNLALNSLIHGFTSEMKGEIRISASVDADDEVCLVVADNGSGISAENLGRVFDPFFTTRMGQGGSGLGLNIVYNIVTTTLGGAIRVESQPGERTAFTITMPRTAPKAEALLRSA